MPLSSPDARSAETAGVLCRPPFLFLGVLILGLVLDWLFPLASPSDEMESIVAVALGAVLFLAGSILLAWCLRVFGKAQTPVPTYLSTKTVVMDGPYRYSRNPIYMAMMLAYLGIALASSSAWSLGLLVPALLVLRYGVVAREERYLEARFGADYLRYKAAVRRWL